MVAARRRVDGRTRRVGRVWGFVEPAGGAENGLRDQAGVSRRKAAVTSSKCQMRSGDVWLN